MTTNHVYERFGALCQCAMDLHNKCREEQTIESLIDTFYHFHGLSSAFAQDCQEYLGEPTTPELRKILGDINTALVCSVSHLRQAADKLHTSILERIIEGFSISVKSIENMN